MTLVMLGIMLVLLLGGFPMMMPLLCAAIVGFVVYYPNLSLQLIIQQMIGGVKPSALIAIPMFILAADIITRGHSADRLVDVVMRFMGHIRGGLAVSVTTACAMFGAVCGSTQATVVAIGGAMRPRMLKAGYNDSFSIGLIINAADLAYLHPSVHRHDYLWSDFRHLYLRALLLPGWGRGLLIIVLFSMYCIWYARRHNIPVEPKANWSERWTALRRALWPAGFPVIVVGGIYGGVFSPTEAAAICVLYALVLELLIFRSIKLKDIADITLSTGAVTSVVFILIAAGAAFSWLLSYAQIPQQIIASLGLEQAGVITTLVAINLAFFIGCMFVDSIVVILILVPIFAPLVKATGLDPVLVGVMITLQVAIGAATPPFGCNIFTAVAVFKRPFVDVIRGIHPFLIILFAVTVLLACFPEIALWPRDLAFR